MAINRTEQNWPDEVTHEVPELLWFTSSSGRIELQMTLEQAESASHQGRCAGDVLALSKVPEIAAQLEAIKPELLAAELKEYGAWDDEARKLAADKGTEALNNPHAMIGRDCKCGSCFCCAAAQVYRELSRYSNRRANEFAFFVKELGFTVYMSKSGTYGFITDDKAERVLSFSFDGLTDKLSGNYGPPSRESGTGWQLSVSPAQLQTAEDVKAALYSAPDYNCGKGWKHFTSVKEHLAMYESSSGYTEI